LILKLQIESEFDVCSVFRKFKIKYLHSFHTHKCNFTYSYQPYSVQVQNRSKLRNFWHSSCACAQICTYEWL